MLKNIIFSEKALAFIKIILYNCYAIFSKLRIFYEKEFWK